MTCSPRSFLTLDKSLVTPVAVSLWTMQIALIVCAESEASFDSRTSRSAPRPHSLSTTSTLKLRRCCWSIQSKLNWPIRNDTVRSPGDSVFVRALSQAPVPSPNEKGFIYNKITITKWKANYLFLLDQPYAISLFYDNRTYSIDIQNTHKRARKILSKQKTNTHNSTTTLEYPMRILQSSSI